MKATFHKSCSCWSCRRGRGSTYGKAVHERNEKKLRTSAKRKLDDVVKGKDDDAVIVPITSPYTD